MAKYVTLKRLFLATLALLLAGCSCPTTIRLSYRPSDVPAGAGAGRIASLVQEVAVAHGLKQVEGQPQTTDNPRLPAAYALRYPLNAEHTGHVQVRVREVLYQQNTFEIQLRDGENPESPLKGEIRQDLTWRLFTDPTVQTLSTRGCSEGFKSVVPTPPP